MANNTVTFVRFAHWCAQAVALAMADDTSVIPP